MKMEFFMRKANGENPRVEDYMPESAPASLEKLDAILEEDRENWTFHDAEDEHKMVQTQEDRLEQIMYEEKALKEFLHVHGIECEVERIGKDLFSIDFDEKDIEELNVASLPQGYVYKGGAARSVLRKVLGLPIGDPRDLDIAFAGGEEDKQLSQMLSQELMPEDYAHGYGVEGFEDDYFTTRDFTINEVVASNDRVILSKKCLLDTVRGVLRIADFEKRESYGGVAFYTKDKLLAKALRFFAAESDRYSLDPDLDEVTVYQEIYYFHIALHLERAIQQGEEVAQRYIDLMVERGQLSEDIDTPQKAIAYLEENTDFVFRITKQDQIRKEEEFIDDRWDGEEDRFQDTTKREGFGKRMVT